MVFGEISSNNMFLIIITALINTYIAHCIVKALMLNPHNVPGRKDSTDSPPPFIEMETEISDFPRAAPSNSVADLGLDLRLLS